MKFLIDAQLPRTMRRWFSDAGFDAMHTLDLPAGNRSTDEQIRRFARNDRQSQTHPFLELTSEGLVLRD